MLASKLFPLTYKQNTGCRRPGKFNGTEVKLNRRLLPPHKSNMIMPLCWQLAWLQVNVKEHLLLYRRKGIFCYRCVGVFWSQRSLYSCSCQKGFFVHLFHWSWSEVNIWNAIKLVTYLCCQEYILIWTQYIQTQNSQVQFYWWKKSATDGNQMLKWTMIL